MYNLAWHWVGKSFSFTAVYRFAYGIKWIKFTRCFPSRTTVYILFYLNVFLISLRAAQLFLLSYWSLQWALGFYFISVRANTTSCGTDDMFKSKPQSKPKMLNHCRGLNERLKGQSACPRVSHPLLEILQPPCCGNRNKFKVWYPLLVLCVLGGGGVLVSDQCYLRGNGSRFKAATEGREGQRD